MAPSGHLKKCMWSEGLNILWWRNLCYPGNTEKLSILSQFFTFLNTIPLFLVPEPDQVRVNACATPASLSKPWYDDLVWGLVEIFTFSKKRFQTFGKHCSRVAVCVCMCVCSQRFLLSSTSLNSALQPLDYLTLDIWGRVIWESRWVAR